MTSPEIASRLRVARPTVETHIATAMRKLGARTVTTPRPCSESGPSREVATVRHPHRHGSRGRSAPGWRRSVPIAELPAEPFDLTALRLAATGSVATEYEAAAVLMAAVRGCSVLVRLTWIGEPPASSSTASNASSTSNPPPMPSRSTPSRPCSSSRSPGAHRRRRRPAIWVVAAHGHPTSRRRQASAGRDLDVEGHPRHALWRRLMMPVRRTADIYTFVHTGAVCAEAGEVIGAAVGQRPAGHPKAPTRRTRTWSESTVRPAHEARHLTITRENMNTDFAGRVRRHTSSGSHWYQCCCGTAASVASAAAPPSEATEPTPTTTEPAPPDAETAPSAEAAPPDTEAAPPTTEAAPPTTEAAPPTTEAAPPTTEKRPRRPRKRPRRPPRRHPGGRRADEGRPGAVGPDAPRPSSGRDGDGDGGLCVGRTRVSQRLRRR